MNNSSKKNIDLCIVGAFPPPVHGMSLVNERIFNELSKITNVDKIDISPTTKNNKFLKFFSRISSVIKGVHTFFKNRLNNSEYSLYVGLSGGMGQLWEAIYILIARITKTKIYLHHHSYAYIDKSSIIFKILIFLSGPETYHILLSKKMELDIKDKYKAIKKTLVVSNATFIKKNQPKNLNFVLQDHVKIGFLSNISFDKGIKDFIETLKNLHNSSVNYSGIIAGRFQDIYSKKFVEKEISKLETVNYIGSINNEDKESFFRSIDLLLFPTKYRNEAQPLVIFEALSFGVPVIAYDRGCISETIKKESGMLIDKSDDFAPIASELINKLYKNNKIYKETSSKSFDIFLDANEIGYSQLRNLSRLMTSNN